MELITSKDIQREIIFFQNQFKSAKLQDRLKVYNHIENQLNDYLDRLNRFHKNESIKCENYLSYLFQSKDQTELYQYISSREFLMNIVNYSDFDVDAVAKFIVDFYSSFTFKLNGNSPVVFGVRLKNIAGDKITQKIRKLTDLKYITKLVWNNFISYKDTVLINKSFKKGEKASVVSTFGAEYVNKKNENQDKYLSSRKIIKDNIVLIDENGQEITLKTLADLKSKNRLNEIVLIKQLFEILQKELGYTFLFSTLTCPAKFKPSPENGNCSYEKGLMVKDAVNLLNECFTVFRKRKNDILTNSKKTPSALKHLKFQGDCYGIWAKEPQKDGTPHTHFLIFCHPADLENYQELFTSCVISVFEKYGLKFDKDNTLKHIIQDKDNSKSPFGYIFKYIFKCLNMSKNEENKEENQSALYHFSLHRYRRYDFFGIDKILTVWREFKRMISYDKNSTQFNHFKEISKNLNNEDKISFYKLYNYCEDNNFKSFKELLLISNVKKLYRITEKEEKYKSIELDYLKPHQEKLFSKSLRGLKLFNLDIELRFFKII